MHGRNYNFDIKSLLNENVNVLIEPIDIEILKSRDIDAAYYIFPLIERMVLETYKLLPLVNIEHYDQGTMRTIISIIENNNPSIFPQELIRLLYKYYDENGVRNKLFHVIDSTGITKFDKSEYDIIELQFIIYLLLGILNTLLEKNMDNIFKVDYV